MKLSEVVRYLNLLESRELDPAYDSITNRLDGITHMIENYPLQFDSTALALNNDLSNIKSAIDQFNHTLQSLKHKLQQEIQAQEPAYYQESTRGFGSDTLLTEPIDRILKRRLKLDFDTDTILRNRLRIYGDWRLPGMIIRPGLENFIEDMVPLDPLYLVDTDLELLQPAISGFTDEYQRRLRPYVISEHADLPILNQLPDNQFGFVFAYYYFNFKPIEIIEKFLHELYEKLRPGGVVIFTYNECDLAPGIGAAEHVWMSYTPGRRIRSMIDSIGFETINNHIGTYDIAWFELRKPGTIVSLRGGQSMAKIIPKIVAKSK